MIKEKTYKVTGQTGKENKLSIKLQASNEKVARVRATAWLIVIESVELMK
jgi:hypothetical protein